MVTKMNKVLLDKEREAFKNSTKLRGIVNNNIPFETAKKIRERQQNEYNKYHFFKNLREAMERENGRKED